MVDFLACVLFRPCPDLSMVASYLSQNIDDGDDAVDPPLGGAWVGEIRYIPTLAYSNLGLSGISPRFDGTHDATSW